MQNLSCFKAYDIRGTVPQQLNPSIAWDIGRAFAAVFKPDIVVTGHDIRESSSALSEALINGLICSGVDVLDIGLCGTEEVYFATTHYQAAGGIMVTASHNPKEYNGMKLVGYDAIPIHGENGLLAIKKYIMANNFRQGVQRLGRIERKLSHRQAYIEQVLQMVGPSKMAPLRLVANSGNGCASLVLDALEPHLPFTWIKVHYKPDGRFPNGVPNPLLPESRRDTIQAIQYYGADMGLAWDGDFDRCFFFDEKGRFIEGYYLVGLLAGCILAEHPGAKILHDPRLVWNTKAIVTERGGVPVMTKTGHAFIKERMRQEDAVYGGEMSAHHYFRDFSYCDSGMIPWLLVAKLLSTKDQPFSNFLDAMIQDYPVSGEINMALRDSELSLARLRDRYERHAVFVENIDGLSMDMGTWRFNIRSSNTEAVVRLNVESRGDKKLMESKTREICSFLQKQPLY